MQIFTSEAISPVLRGSTPSSGNILALDLEQFPELDWLPDYLTALTALQHERDHLTQAIQAVTADGEAYRGYWIESYTKSKNGKQYTYHQLRWLTGERKKSGQPNVKTKHLSYRAVGEVRAAILRGQQVEALEKQCQQVEAEMFKLRQLVRGTGSRLRRVNSQNSLMHPLDHSRL